MTNKTTAHRPKRGDYGVAIRQVVPYYSLSSGVVDKRQPHDEWVIVRFVRVARETGLVTHVESHPVDDSAWREVKATSCTRVGIGGVEQFRQIKTVAAEPYQSATARLWGKRYKSQAAATDAIRAEAGA